MTGPRRVAAALLLFGAPLAGQSGGAVAGRVRDASTGRAVHGALVTVDGGRQGAATDTSGAYRIREVRSGWHRVQANAIGFRPVIHDSVLVLSGETVTLNFDLHQQAVIVESILVQASPDRVLDPLAPQDLQRITAQEIRRLPVTTVEEAVALSAGAVGESYRGGRLGEQSFVLDGLGVKNQVDASTGPLGLRIPPDILTEASLVTNAFSARYGQAVSGLVNVVTKDPGDRWQGRGAYETDRPLWDGLDYGIDRAVVAAEGPLGAGVGLLAALDAESRVDADPVNAPPPTDPRDPRAAEPWLLPHNGGQRLDAALKLTVPLGGQTIRLFGLRSVDQRMLFDPAYKYDAEFAPARRVRGDLLSGHVQRTFGNASVNPVTVDLRVGWFDRDFFRGTVDRAPGAPFGPFPTTSFHFLGEGLARAKDTLTARAAIPGFTPPSFSERTPWGVPAFFLTAGSRGEIAWNRFRELRTQLDLTLGGGRDADFYLGGEFAGQRVETFQRIRSYLPVGFPKDTVAMPTASDFRPRTASAYGETQLRVEDIAFTFGLRYDQFEPRTTLLAGRRPGGGGAVQRSINPRIAVSTVLRNATFVASIGRFSQAPDFQYLVDAAFDDTLRTGRFRRGNPDLGFESAVQYEFSLRVRPTDITAVRVNLYVKHLDGLVASVPLGLTTDSAIFGNGDFGTVKGLELLFEREVTRGWGVRASYTLMTATATATNAFQILRRVRLGTLGDTIYPARVEFPLDYDRRHALTVISQARVREDGGPRIAGFFPLGGVEVAAIGRYNSGLPYTRTNATGDTLIGLPNSFRLPAEKTLDVMVRRPLSVGGLPGGLYLDVRNLFNWRNLESVRRDTGTPGADQTTIQTWAQNAYTAHPEAIPYESPRYRAWADRDGNGYIDGAGELMPLYLAAAQDFGQALFAYGPPRLVRLGVEFSF
jgi:Carboxypeptidase regulatory-like domain